MRTLKLTIAYDGTRYAGWQIQNNSTKQSAVSSKQKPARTTPTIQETIERVLGRILQERVRVVASGRTDAGVHALAQVAHLKTRSNVSGERLLRSVNQLLPRDLAVTKIEEAQKTFHARFSPSRKRYRYRMFTGPVVPPFIRPYVHHVRTSLDLALMRREAAGLNGGHDFKGFARRGGRGRATTRRTISSITLKRSGPELHLDVEGNGFLHTMVRSIAGTLMDIGRGRLPAGTVHHLLRSGERTLAGTTAPAKGLSLISVQYADDR